MSNNNVTDINVNKAELTNEQHAEAWSIAVGNNDVDAVIATLNAYSAVNGIVSIEAYLEMKVMLHDAMPDARRVAYTPSKGWYDAGVNGENIGAPVGG